jgi:hypothetical protein
MDPKRWRNWEEEGPSSAGGYKEAGLRPSPRFGEVEFEAGESK